MLTLVLMLVLTNIHILCNYLAHIPRQLRSPRSSSTTYSTTTTTSSTVTTTVSITSAYTASPTSTSTTNTNTASPAPAPPYQPHQHAPASPVQAPAPQALFQRAQKRPSKKTYSGSRWTAGAAEVVVAVTLLRTNLHCIYLQYLTESLGETSKTQLKWPKVTLL